MTTEVIASQTEDESDEAVPGIEVSATIENNTVRFEKFPIEDIVLSIVKDEDLASQIVEAIGDVNYDIAYVPTLSAAKDVITMTLNPEPLKISIPASAEGEEAASLVVEVEVVAGGTNAEYTVMTGNLKFSIDATKVMLGEGEEQQEFTDFVPTSFHFDMNQHKVSHH